MDVYQLRAIGGGASGMALVAAPTFAIAKNIYLEEGSLGEYYYFKEFDFSEKYSQPIEGLVWQGAAGIICEEISID